MLKINLVELASDILEMVRMPMPQRVCLHGLLRSHGKRTMFKVLTLATPGAAPRFSFIGAIRAIAFVADAVFSIAHLALLWH